jgi:hypothetical protein
MRNKWITLLALSVALSITVGAADIAGKWTAQVPGRNGPRNAAFEFKADGGKLTGSMDVEGQKTDIAEGTASGDTISFSVTADRGGNSVTYKYTGKIAGDEIQFKREGGRGPAREFTAKRVK